MTDRTPRQLGEVTLTDEEDARLVDALRHIDTAAHDLHRLRGESDPR